MGKRKFQASKRIPINRCTFPCCSRCVVASGKISKKVMVTIVVLWRWPIPYKTSLSLITVIDHPKACIIWRRKHIQDDMIGLFSTQGGKQLFKRKLNPIFRCSWVPVSYWSASWTNRAKYKDHLMIHILLYDPLFISSFSPTHSFLSLQ